MLMESFQRGVEGSLRGAKHVLRVGRALLASLVLLRHRERWDWVLVSGMAGVLKTLRP